MVYTKMSWGQVEDGRVTVVTGFRAGRFPDRGRRKAGRNWTAFFPG